MEALVLYRCGIWQAVAPSGDVALQPVSDLVLIAPDPFDVVPHRLQCLLPRHLPGTSVWSSAEKMLHL